MDELEVLVRLGMGARQPEHKSAGAAGLDLYCLERTQLYRDKWTKVRTGVSLQIPEGYEGCIRGRSGLALEAFEVFIGTIDSDYRGEIAVIAAYKGAFNEAHVEAGTRIAQLLISPIARARLRVVEDLEPTERGDKGFGSSGI